MGVALALFLLSPVTLLAWAAGQALLRITGLRWWKLALASLAAIAAAASLRQLNQLRIRSKRVASWRTLLTTFRAKNGDKRRLGNATENIPQLFVIFTIHSLQSIKLSAEVEVALEWQP